MVIDKETFDKKIIDFFYSERYKDVRECKDYYFKKLDDKYKSFLNYQISEQDIDKLISLISDVPSENDREGYWTDAYLSLLPKDEFIKGFTNILLSIISTLDLQFKRCNLYEDGRTVIGYTGIYQNYWFEGLLNLYKNINFNKKEKIRKNVQKSIDYLNDKINNYPIVTDEDLTNLNKIKPFLEKLKVECKNIENKTWIIKDILYLPEIVDEWNDKETIDKYPKAEQIACFMFYDGENNLYSCDDIRRTSKYNFSSKPPKNIWSLLINYSTPEYIVQGKELGDKTLFKRVDDKFLLTEYGKERAREIIKKLLWEKQKVDGEEDMTKLAQPLNQILYGPPGTGKTYNTIIEAIKILDKSLYQRYYEYINNKDKKDFEFDAEKHATYEDLQTEFNNYKGQGRIEFITFHQSYSYEEFVEGIKPEIGTEDLKYNYDKGIFKQISQRALFERLNINKDKPQKILDFENLKDTFINNNDIGTQIQTEAKKSYIEITNYTENAIRVKPVKGSSTYSVFYRYIQKLLELDITERTSIKQYIPEAKGLASYYFAIINKFKELQNSSINTANTTTDISNISDEAKEQLINEYYKNCIDLKPIEECKSYVLIIDEINRGNISKIFGELITLIEDDKRAGGKHQLIVTLPYTKEQFAVPDNLYIIGTMNTADRSIALLDTALRRRFEFEEMPPRPELLKTDLTINGEEINLQKFLIGLNYNITEIGNLDKDHKIGHAFLINVNGREGLKRAFLNKIYPLLEEYFYDDDKKIKEVLNQDQKFDLSCLNNKTDKEEKWLNVIKDVIDKSEGNK